MMWSMHCLCRNLLNSSAVKGAIVSVQDVRGTILGHKILGLLD